MEELIRAPVVKALAWTMIDRSFDLGKSVITDQIEVRSLGQLTTQYPVCVLNAAALPGRVRVGKVHAHRYGAFDRCKARELRTAVHRERAPKPRGQALWFGWVFRKFHAIGTPVHVRFAFKTARLCTWMWNSASPATDRFAGCGTDRRNHRFGDNLFWRRNRFHVLSPRRPTPAFSDAFAEAKRWARIVMLRRCHPDQRILRTSV